MCLTCNRLMPLSRFPNPLSRHCFGLPFNSLVTTPPRAGGRAGRTARCVPLHGPSFSSSRSWNTIPSPIPIVMPSPCLWFLSSSVLHRSVSLRPSRSPPRPRSLFFFRGPAVQACPACSRAATAARRSCGHKDAARAEDDAAEVRRGRSQTVPGGGGDALGPHCWACRSKNKVPCRSKSRHLGPNASELDSG